MKTMIKLLTELLLILIYLNSAECVEIRLKLASKALNGESAGYAYVTDFSADKSKVLYRSLSHEIVENDNNTYPLLNTRYSALGWDIFLYDLLTDSTTRISVRDDGEEYTFASSSLGVFSPDINAIAFSTSSASAVDDVTTTMRTIYNLPSNIIYFDMNSRSYHWITKDSDNVEQFGTSPKLLNENTIVFSSSSAGYNVINATVESRQFHIYLTDVGSTEFKVLNLDADGQVISLPTNIEYDITPDGRFLVFIVDQLKYGSEWGTQILLLDQTNHSIIPVSVNSDLQWADRGANAPQISSDGRFIVFKSDSSNLVELDPNPYSNDDPGPNLFIYDRLLGSILAIETPHPYGDDYFISYFDISDKANFIVFQTPHGVYRYDRKENEILVIHEEQQRMNGGICISKDGNTIAFSCEASLVPEDTNGDGANYFQEFDVYLAEIINDLLIDHWNCY